MSSTILADTVGVSAAQVRRDLASLGHLGQRGIGYEPASLAQAIRHTLGINRQWKAIVVGIGNLARAILRYRGFGEHGFHIVGLFDADPMKIGENVDGLTIEAISAIQDQSQKYGAELGILCVPSESAQSVADQLAAAGIQGLMNFAPVILKVPSRIQVITVDLAIQLEQLAFAVHMARTPSANSLSKNADTLAKEKTPSE